MQIFWGIIALIELRRHRTIYRSLFDLYIFVKYGGRKGRPKLHTDNKVF